MMRFLKYPDFCKKNFSTPPIQDNNFDDYWFHLTNDEKSFLQQIKYLDNVTTWFICLNYNENQPSMFSLLYS
jgi:hypothetical protein